MIGKAGRSDRSTVQQLAKEKYRSSGLSDAVAKRLHLTALSAEQTAALGSNFHRAAALRIPYFDLNGRPTKFYRIRYLGPLPGFAGQVQKPQRFAQEIKTLNEVYLPPLFSKSWEEMAKDASLPIFITEGELKAAAGCAAGLATVGIGGVDVWRSAKRGITFLPVLAKFHWKERQVAIIYDSDLAYKPDVVRAQRSLAQELLSRGAEVQIVTLPAAEDGHKQGLDDYLVNQGADALQELVESATPFPESDALWGMNEELLVIRDPGIVVERKTGRLMEVNRFIRLIYANRHYMETAVKAKSISLVKKPLAPHWVEWEHRAEMERITYEPGKPKEYNGLWNVWPGWGCNPKKGELGPWYWLLDFLFKSDTKTRRWFERWLAYPIQHPGAKMYAATLLWSREQRIGKTLIAYAMKGIYGQNFVEIKSKDLKGNFNSWAKNRQFVYGDEIKGNEAKVDADWFKGLITQDEVMIEEKFIPKYTVPDHMNYYCSSNHPDALFLEDRDQRFLIGEVLGKPADRVEYEKVDHWLHNGGPPALFHHLLDANLGNFNPREHAPETEGKRSMIMLGKSDAGVWVQLLRDNPAMALAPLGAGIANACDLFTPTQLYRAFDPDRRSHTNAASLGRALASAGFRQLNHNIPIVTCLGAQRLYPVRDLTGWEQSTATEIKEHFNKFWAPDSTERKMP